MCIRLEQTKLGLQGGRPGRKNAQIPDLQPGTRLCDFEQIVQLLSAPVSLSVRRKK